MQRIGFINFLSVFLICGLVIALAGYIQKDQIEIEQIRLGYVIDAATDGAVEELLETDDIEADYAEYGRIRTNPETALDIFTTMFMLSYNINPNEEAKQHIQMNFMPTFAVAAYDGVYIAEQRPIRDDGSKDYGLIFRPKTPYIYEDSNALYALNLGGENAMRIKDNKYNKVYSVPNLTTRADHIAEINASLTREVGKAIDKANENSNHWSNVFFLPGELTTYTGVNPVDGVSVLALVENVNLTTPKPISAFSIAGSKIKVARMVLAYQRDGVPYYCYADKAPAGLEYENMYTSMEEAAEAGYYYDVKYMQDN